MRPLDRIDYEIVAALQKNARLPNKRLAERLGIAPSTALERTRRLHEEGAFTGYHAEVAPRAVGIGLQALVAIRLKVHSRTSVEAFHDHILALPQVVALYHVAGVNDFLAHVAVRDTEHMRQFALEAFAEREEVVHFETSLIYEFVRHPVLPQYREEGEK